MSTVLKRISSRIGLCIAAAALLSASACVAVLDISDQTVEERIAMHQGSYWLIEDDDDLSTPAEAEDSDMAVPDPGYVEGRALTEQDATVGATSAAIEADIQRARSYLIGKKVFLGIDRAIIGDERRAMPICVVNDGLSCVKPGRPRQKWQCVKRLPDMTSCKSLGSVYGECAEYASGTSGYRIANAVGVIDNNVCVLIRLSETRERGRVPAASDIRKDRLGIRFRHLKGGPVSPSGLAGGPRRQYRATPVADATTPD